MGMRIGWKVREETSASQWTRKVVKGVGSIKFHYQTLRLFGARCAAPRQRVRLLVTGRKKMIKIFYPHITKITNKPINTLPGCLTSLKILTMRSWTVVFAKIWNKIYDPEQFLDNTTTKKSNDTHNSELTGRSVNKYVTGAHFEDYLTNFCGHFYKMIRTIR